MSAPVFWIIFPGIAAGLLFFLRRWTRLTVILGVMMCLLLAGLAWQLPVAKLISLGPWSFRIEDTLSILGRRFLLQDADRPLILIIYLMAAFWFGAAHVSRAGRLFVPLGLAVVVLLTAALAVEPFLYAALMIEIAVLISVPILVISERPAHRGVLRYVTFQTLGIPFILITEWMVAGVEASPGDLARVIQATILLGFGFALLLAITPFHTWVVMLAEEANPYAVAFIATMLPLMIAMLGMNFLDRYAWLRGSVTAQLILRLAGLLVSLTGGIGIAFQRKLERVFGFGLLSEMGFSILSLGLPPEGYALFFSMLLPKSISFGVWALSLSVLKDSAPELNYTDISGLARSKPIAAAGLVLAHLSVAGFPLLAGFPVRLALWQMVAQISLTQAVLAFLAGLGLLVSGLRALSILVTGPEDKGWTFAETWQSSVLLVLGVISILIVGLFPQWFLPSLADGLSSFLNLYP